jgi:hypothetical protein
MACGELIAMKSLVLEKRSFFVYRRMTAASLILMELFVTIAFLVTLWMTGGSKISLLILAQGAIFCAWWWGRRRANR